MHRLQINSLPLPVPDYDDPKDLYAFCGLAVYYAQLMEHRLLYLAAVIRQTGCGLITQQQCGDLSAALNWQTVSPLFRAACCVVAMPENFSAMLSDALQKRRYLSDRFFKVHVEDSWSGTGRRSMIEELQEMIILFKQADQQIERLALAVRHRFNVSEAWVEKELETLRSGAPA